MNEFYPYPKRDPIKNYFPLPNELFLLNLTAGEIAIYAFLMRWENRKDYSCVESYQEIGDAVSMSRNTVSKYVAMLEERGLIRTEHTSIITRDGRKGNGKLRYKILPIQEAIDRHYKRKLVRLERDTARYNVKKAQAHQHTPAGNASLS